MLKPIIVAALLVIVDAEYQSYRPRGWRPSGRSFEPTHSDDRSLRNNVVSNFPQSYGYPTKDPTTYEPLSTTTTTTTTTPRSREPTTSPNNLDDQDYDTGPALAVANSFAFNRPVYVYNTFPLHAGLTFVK